MFQNRIKSAGGFVLIFVLVACSSTTPTDTLAPPTATSTRIPATSTATHTAIPPTATVLPSRIPPTPTATLPAPSPLNANGPWLVHGEYDTKELFLTNIDGTGLLRIELPDCLSYFFLSGPDSVYNHNMAITRIEESLLVIQLPDGEIVRELPLIAPEALPILNSLGSSTQNLLGYDGYLSQGSMRFSPDGRYLAYQAISENASVDIYIYDFLSDKVQQITNQSADEFVRAWTPDGQRILFFHSRNSLIHSGEDAETRITGSVSLYGSSIETTDGPTDWDVIFHWLNNYEYLMYDWGFESLGGNIRKINLRTGQSTMIYSGGFLNFAYNPIKREFLFLERPEEYFGWEPDVPYGIYRMDKDTLEMQMVLPGFYRGLGYNEHFNLYSVRDGENETITYFDNEGTVICSRSWGGTGRYSPNGIWVLESFPGEYHLYDGNCTLVMKTDYSGAPLWLRDSSGFQINGSVIVRFLEENNWLPEIINDNPAFDRFINVIFP